MGHSLAFFIKENVVWLRSYHVITCNSFRGQRP